MEGRRYWQQRLREVAKRRIQIRTLAAFNANVDVIVHVTPEAMARLLEKPGEIDLTEMRRAAESNPTAVRTKSELVGVLKACLARGKSYHLQAADQALLDWLEIQFPAADRSMGGQAGIIGNQMAMLGAASRAYCPLLSEAQAALFVPGVEVPAVVDGRLQLRPARAAARPGDP
ncbi:MAG TPA: ADP-dependent glucokinase/phosphofructokinase, partial [Limnochordia bacterium]